MDQVGCNVQTIACFNHMLFSINGKFEFTTMAKCGLGMEMCMLTGDSSLQLTEQMRNARVGAILIKPVPAEEIRNSCIRLLQLDREVREISTKAVKEIPLVKLRKIFLQELQTRLPELDRDIEELDWASARSILHQLTASCAMCQEKDLERLCRQLFDVLAERPEPGTLTRAYYPLLKEAAGIGVPLQT